MNKLCLYLFCLLYILGACTRSDDWEGKPGGSPGLKKVSLEMAVSEGSVFEENIHALAVYAFTQTGTGNYAFYKKVADLTEEQIKALEAGEISRPGAGDSKLLKLTLPEGFYSFFYVANDLTGEFVEPPSGGSSDQAYMPYPSDGEVRPYFMANAVQKPGVTGDIPIYVLLSRVVSRLTVTVDGVPDDIDTIRYRIDGVASRILLSEKAGGDAISVDGVYARDRVNAASSVDTVVSRLLLFPSLAATAALQLSFYSGSVLVREKNVVITDLKPDNDVYITGRWDVSGLTR